jgi:hypothetical protein
MSAKNFFTEEQKQAIQKAIANAFDFNHCAALNSRGSCTGHQRDADGAHLRICLQYDLRIA